MKNTKVMLHNKDFFILGQLTLRKYTFTIFKF